MPAPKGNKFALGGPGGGRPTDFQKKYAKIAYKICLMGGTDKDLADAFGVSEVTIGTWKKKHEEFSLALKEGKTIADAEVSHSLFKRATGYSCPEVDIKVIDGKIVKTKIIRHYPPDATSMIFWMKNRRGKGVNGTHAWADKQTIEHGGSIDLTGSIVTFE